MVLIMSKNFLRILCESPKATTLLATNSKKCHGFQINKNKKPKKGRSKLSKEGRWEERKQSMIERKRDAIQSFTRQSAPRRSSPSSPVDPATKENYLSTEPVTLFSGYVPWKCGCVQPPIFEKGEDKLQNQ